MAKTTADKTAKILIFDIINFTLFIRGYNSHKVKHYRVIIKTRATHTRTKAHTGTHATPKRGQTRTQTETHIHTDTKTRTPIRETCHQTSLKPEKCPTDVRRAKIPTLRTYFPTLRTYFPALRT